MGWYVEIPVIWVNCSDTSQVKRHVEARDRFFEVCLGLGGSIVDGYGGWAVKEFGEDAIGVLAGLKSALDPAFIPNPNNF